VNHTCTQKRQCAHCGEVHTCANSSSSRLPVPSSSYMTNRSLISFRVASSSWISSTEFSTYCSRQAWKSQGIRVSGISHATLGSFIQLFPLDTRPASFSLHLLRTQGQQKSHRLTLFYRFRCMEKINSAQDNTGDACRNGQVCHTSSGRTELMQTLTPK